MVGRLLPINKWPYLSRFKLTQHTIAAWPTDSFVIFCCASRPAHALQARCRLYFYLWVFVGYVFTAVVLCVDVFHV